MIRSLHTHFLWWIFLIGALALVWLLPLPVTAQSTTRLFQLAAHQFEFTPGRIEVNQGDVVTIKLASSDVVHGFYLDGYGIEQSITPGISQEITFTADQPGKFHFRCSVNCGSLHPFMIGELVVNANSPFWRAGATLTLSAAAFLLYLGRFGGKEA